MYPMPNIRARRSATTISSSRPTYDTLGYQPAVRLDYQPTPGLGSASSIRGTISEAASIGTIPGWNDSIMPRPAKGHGRRHGQLQPQLDDVPRSAPTGARATSWPAMAACRERRRGLPEHRARGSAADLPGRDVINPDYYAYEILNFQNPPYWDGTRICKVPSFSWGNRIVPSADDQRARRPTSSIPASSTSTRPRTSRSA